MVETTFSLATFEYFLLILVRIASFLFVAPFFNQRGVPGITKVGLAGMISFLVLYSIKPEEEVYLSAIGYGALVVKEAVTGLLIGYMANICQSIVVFAGTLIDTDMGLSMANEFDPTLNTQITMTGNIYLYGMLLLMLTTDVYHYIVRAIIDSFNLITLGGAVLERDTLLEAFVSYMVNLFIIAFRIMLPIFAVMLVMNIVLGIMAKVAPQMNMFSVGIQIKIIVGILTLFVVVFLFPKVVELIFNEMRILIVDIVEGLT